MNGAEKQLYLIMHSAGRQDCSDFHSWGPGVRQNYVIHYIVRGTGYFSSGGESYRVCAGESFIIYPNTLIEYHPDPDDPWEYVWTDFSGVEAHTLLSQTAFSESNPVSPNMGTEPFEIFEALVAFGVPSGAEELCYANGLLHMLISLYIGHFPAGGERAGLYSLERVLSFIVDNIYRPEINIEAVAAAVNLNRVSLYRQFLRELGVSPSRYIAGVRMDKARELLNNSDMPIKAIAYSVGFQDPLYFSKVFRNENGVSPTEYRKMQVKYPAYRTES